MEKPEVITRAKTVRVPRSQLKEVKMNENWLIKGIHETVSEEASDALINQKGSKVDMCLICEELQENTLVFYQISELLNEKAIFVPMVKGLDVRSNS